MRKLDEILLFDECLEDEPDELFALPEIKQGLAQEHQDDELGLRALWEHPEAGLPGRLSRVSAATLRRLYPGNSELEGDVGSPA